MSEEITKKESSNLSLVERLKKIKTNGCLMLDVSTSMNSDVEPGKTKMQALCDIVSGLKTNPAMYLFGSIVRRVKKDDIPTYATDGNTLMAPALAQVKLEGHNSVVMITDGEATDKLNTLEAIKGMHVQILYVGAGAKPTFLDDLAKAGCGSCTKDDLTKPLEIEEKLMLLLNSGQDDDIRINGRFQL